MRCLFAVMFVLLLLSCKKETTAENPGSIYPEQAIGAIQNGAYTIANPDELAKSWAAKADEISGLTGFEIVKGKTEGDATEDFYMLVATTKDGTAKVASLLELRENKFYFGSTGHNDSESYVLIICKGQCDTGCLPVARIKRGMKSLICSFCVDCIKVEKGIY